MDKSPDRLNWNAADVLSSFPKLRLAPNETPLWNSPELLESNNLGFLRFLMAALVVLSHSWALNLGHERTEPLSRLTRGEVTLGGLAVDAFFVISGFLILQSWARSSGFKSYLLRRVRRIVPGFFACVLLTGCIVVPLAVEQPSSLWNGHYVGSLLGNVLRLRFGETAGVFSSNPYPGAANGSLWSISYEFWCYLGVAMCGTAGLFRRRSFFAAIFAVISMISLCFAVTKFRPGSGPFGFLLGSPRLWARMLPFFMAGMLMHLYRDRLKFTTLCAVGAAALLVGVAVYVPAALSVALPTAGGYLLLSIAFAPIGWMKSWDAHSDYSYGMYLFAFPIQQFIVRFLGPMQPLAHFLVALPLVICAGFLSWNLVERRWLGARRADIGPRIATVNSAPADPDLASGRSGVLEEPRGQVVSPVNLDAC
jgi:peptidoglycan/LPS O-acetylase OafA/YrhL